MVLPGEAIQCLVQPTTISSVVAREHGTVVIRSMTNRL